ncbi:TPA: Replication-associated protein G2P [Escherichia coli]|nr:Replication-associated protein G2P [Escherichia coli]
MMIDWLTLRIPCDHSREIAGGAMVSYKDAWDFDAGADWCFTKPLAVVGSHDANVRLKTSGFSNEGQSGTELHIDGNLVKFFQGHNLFGSCDIVGLVCDFMDHICSMESLGLHPTDFQKQAWRRGLFKLSRVDVTSMYRLNNRNDVLSWISSAEYSSTMAHRGRGQLTKGSTLYFGKHSRRWSLKFYSKGQEVNCKGHSLPLELPSRDKLLAYAEPALRSELTLRSMTLKETDLQLAANWPRNAEGITRIFEKYLAGLNMSDTRTIPAEQLAELPSGARLAYQSWLEGHDLKNMLPHNTFYRHRRALLTLGVDIATVLPREKSNVVPLVRVLEAIPMGIPDWAYGTPLYHQPVGF